MKKKRINTSKFVVRVIANDMQPIFDAYNHVAEQVSSESMRDCGIVLGEPKFKPKFKDKENVGFLAAFDIYILKGEDISNFYNLNIEIPKSLNNRDDYDLTFQIKMKAFGDTDYHKQVVYSVRDSFHNTLVGNKDYIDTNILVSDSINKTNFFPSTMMCIFNGADLDKVPKNFVIFDKDIIEKNLKEISTTTEN